MGRAPHHRRPWWVTATDYKDYKGTVNVGDNTVTTFDFTMAMPGAVGKVKGQALDMNTGELLKGVTVTLDSKSTTTDKNGSYSLDNVKNTGRGTLERQWEFRQKHPLSPGNL